MIYILRMFLYQLRAHFDNWDYDPRTGDDPDYWYGY